MIVESYNAHVEGLHLYYPLAETRFSLLPPIHHWSFLERGRAAILSQEDVTRKNASTKWKEEAGPFYLKKLFYMKKTDSTPTPRKFIEWLYHIHLINPLLLNFRVFQILPLKLTLWNILVHIPLQ